ncbi:hypothetical protein A9Q99_01605 [Gammaproteobacteria bacterium 45_16_T64]|nr:hypothetical protein A9Q99_01605 [Gammaproteobacteria bacterium 45_16_T64]
MNNTIKYSILASVLSLLATVIVTVIALHHINKLRPIKVFVEYYTCRIVDYVQPSEDKCKTLPTVSINLPQKVNAQQLGAPDPQALQVFFKSNSMEKHIYAHRTNSPERVLLYRKYYSAFEFDAIWDGQSGSIDIFHWPERESMDFHLSDFLTLAPDKSRYWMDLKNLDMNNVREFSNYMNLLVNKNNQLSKDNIIIESKNVQAVSFLENQGFRTSYYLPTNVDKDNCDNNRMLTDRIIGNIQDYPTRYISFPYAQQNYVDNCLLPITGEIAQISWGGLPFAIPEGASQRYHAYIVDHSLEYSEL